jgi:hypothetical protein
MSREDALDEIARPPYLDADLEKQDLDFTIKKMEISKNEFDSIMKLPIKTIHNYPNNFDKWETLRKIYWRIKKKKS